ncbi:hypothetical protein PAXINDRAFT_16386 [Paxillus involutus ATCC 200175]|uniref:Uncharacterized protein n=1 Tax=Paxillus involutus ATCC 200175 TaxID=664439 RepID=A0A0C9TTT9_PAXIN|nr:hypothetical protein PAXINDRAFT_16386 [Paxillus involutus ATCC 200175]
MPHPPNMTCQMAYEEATDPLNSNASTGMMKPAGTSNRLLNGSNEVEGENGREVIEDIEVEDEKDKSIPPPSVPLEGEKNGQQPSGHIDKAAMHLEAPQHKLTTMHLIQMPYDKESSRESQ